MILLGNVKSSILSALFKRNQQLSYEIALEISVQFHSVALFFILNISMPQIEIILSFSSQSL
jgi:hypothetical protein